MTPMLPAVLFSVVVFVLGQSNPDDVERALRIIKAQTQNSQSLNAEEEIQKIRSQRHNPALDEIDKLEEQFRKNKETNVLHRLVALISNNDTGAYAAQTLIVLRDVISSNNFERLVLPQIIKGIESGPDPIKGSCVDVLNAFAETSEAAIRVLINLVPRSSERVGLLEAIETFGNASSQKSITVPVLIELLQEPERPFEELPSGNTQHALAAKALGKLGAPKESHRALRSGLTSSNPYTRLECANALLLNNAYLEEVYRTFEGLLRAKEPVFREEALLFLVLAKHELPEHILSDVRRLSNEGSKDQKDLAHRLLEVLRK